MNDANKSRRRPAAALHPSALLRQRDPEHIDRVVTPPVPTATAPSETAPSEPMARGTVQRGRTIDVATGERRQVGYDKTTGAPVFGSVTRRAKPGEEITLPASEIARLKALGFLIDESRVAQLSAAELKRLDRTYGGPPAAA